MVVVRAILAVENSLEELLSDVRPPERGGVGPAPRPVHPRDASVGQEIARLDGEHRREIVLVHVARRPTELLEFRVEFQVLDDGGGELTVDLEPLGSLAPLGYVHLGQHVGVVASPPEGPVVVECPDEAVLGFRNVVVDEAELVEWDAGFGEEDEPLVGDVEQRVGKKPSLRVAHAHPSPLRDLLLEQC